MIYSISMNRICEIDFGTGSSFYRLIRRGSSTNTFLAATSTGTGEQQENFHHLIVQTIGPDSDILSNVEEDNMQAPVEMPPLEDALTQVPLVNGTGV